MSKQKYQTPKAVITPQQLAKIRAAARQFLLAGGSPIVGDSALDDHIGNVREWMQPDCGDELNALIDRHLPEHVAHEAVSEAAWVLASAEGEAGFHFGVAVGCELIAQTLGIQTPTAHVWKCDETTKGGTS